MRKILLALVLIFPLTGCAGLAEGVLNLPTGVLTKSVDNPITKERLYQIENALTLAVVSLNIYKDKCVKKLIEQSCRQTVASLQTYTRKAPPLIRSLRKFVKANDQVNAKVIFATAFNLYQEFKAEATAKGVLQ